MNAGRISVVMPVFNGERFLGEAIESILAQDDSPLEILVVDDGSTDGSAAVAQSFGGPVRVIRQANAGHVVARNRGILAARGEYVATLDADDLFSPDKFALQVGRLDRHPEIDIVVGQLSYLRPADGEGGEVAFVEHLDNHLSLSFGTCLFRREVFDRVGLGDETMPFADDWDWFMRAREARIPLLVHRHVVLHYRLHDANMTRDREAGARYTLHMMRRSLARRRGRGDLTSLPPLSSFLEPEEGPT